ncbi:MAG: hypothetical protein GXN92_01795 [Candidatus Micrarchaeota archaeon]|nr:hypothetical protein [Candidatus Micrarchaeota archaeon]
MMWIFMLVSVALANNIVWENQTVPFFHNELINVYIEGYGEYGVIIKDGRIVEIKEETFPNPTVEIKISKKAAQFYEWLFSLDIPYVEKREKAIRYLKRHLGKEIEITFYGWDGLFKLLLLKLYLVVV